MVTTHSPGDLKEAVRDFWNSDPCGTRYLEKDESFEAHARERYRLEPYIHEFAGFSSSKGLKVLEIGVGMGADYLEWLRAGAQATGIDLSSASLDRARQRCERAGYTPDLHVADAEHLPFPDNSYDVVYSYGVMHHSPDTRRCLQEALRVLKPGGQARIMLYHHPSWTGLMLWLRYGLLRGKSLRHSVYEYLESPGTKSFTEAELRELMRDYNDLRLRIEFSPGDLLLHEPSARFQSRFYRVVWQFFPRGLVRRLGQRWGLSVLIKGNKPSSFGECTSADLAN